MNVVYISNDVSIKELTIGKTYRVLLNACTESRNDVSYYIKNDNGYLISYAASRFKKVHEIRNEKLNQLGI